MKPTTANLNSDPRLLSQDAGTSGEWFRPHLHHLPLEKTRKGMVEYLSSKGLNVNDLKARAAAHFTSDKITPGKITIVEPDGDLTDDDFASWGDNVSGVGRQDAEGLSGQMDSCD